MMRLLIFCLALGTFASLHAQKENDGSTMQPKVYNFYRFTPDVKMDISKEPALFPDSLRNHPEFGIVPFNAQCTNCYEELGKRTRYTRFFVEPGTNGKHHYSQSSYFPLHYKNEDGYWVTLDHRMKDANNAIYTCNNDPVLYMYNSALNRTSIKTGKGHFTFNTALEAFYLSSTGVKTNIGSLNETNKNLGNDGVLINDAWQDINIQHIFKRGGIKTNFIIMQKPNTPSNSEYLVFEQLLSVDKAEQFIDYSNSNGYFNQDGLFVGDIEVKGKEGDLQFVIHEATFYDGYGYGTKGGYKLSRKSFPILGAGNGASYSLQLYVPVAFLNDPNVRYPLYIDPLVTGKDSLGVFSQADPQGNFSANMAFSNTPATCNYQLTVQVPGMSDIVNTKIDIEYENTFSATCGTPPLQPPFCQFQDVRMEVRSLDCPSTTGPLTCAPAAPPFIGTCTTDPNLVPGASALQYPNFLNCIPPQCPDYFMDFELLNSEIQCDGDVCGYNCARGHYWAVTIEARTIENVITLSRDTICAGDTVTLTAFPEWGVPPYTYVWSDGQTDSIITFTTETDAFVSCTAFDVCGNPALPQDIFLVAKPSPDADAGDTAKLCEGGSATIGGTPTTTGFAPTFVWTAEPANATTFLNTTSSSNPVANIPAGTIDTFLYIVRVNDQGCFRRDSVNVFSGANPTVTIAPDTAYICPGEGATFNATEPFVVYNWSDGSSNPELTVFNLGNFDVTVTDGNGCTASSNTVTTAQPNLPTFDLFATPDSSFNFGESAILGATIDLNVPPVDSFDWGPPVNISCLDCPDPIVSPETDQVYILEVYSQGCLIRDSIFIDIKFPNAYWIPKAFTPNQDGVNDRFFIIKESGVTVSAFQIFNRWGQKIYDNTFPWDGTSKGEQMDMGVYSYIFKLVLADGKELVEAGQVTLIR